MMMGQSIVLSEIETEVPLENNDPAYQKFLLQQNEERIMDAGFISVVEIGQYFMTKDNGEQFYAKACREYSHKKKLPDEQNSSNQPNQSQSQSVIDQGNVITNKTCLLLKVKRSRFQEIKVKSSHEELCSSDRSGQPDITHDVTNVQTCPSEEDKNVRVEQTHDRSGQPDKHNVAVQDNPEVYREIKTLNTDN